MTAPVSPSAPVAWRLVPVEPTEAMLDNAACYEHAPALKSIYRAMLAASPAPSMVGLREKVAIVEEWLAMADDIEPTRPCGPLRLVPICETELHAIDAILQALAVIPQAEDQETVK